jgi:hypothetical protein
MKAKDAEQEVSYNRALEKLYRFRQRGMGNYHKHSAVCGHERMIHGNHVDYIVNGRLHFPHKTHCDGHGPIQILVEYFITLTL